VHPLCYKQKPQRCEYRPYQPTDAEFFAGLLLIREIRGVGFGTDIKIK
jgi:hypothetical protein